MKKRVVRSSGFEVPIGSSMTINNVVVKITDEFIDNNKDLFDIEGFNPTLQMYESILSEYSHWQIIKSMEPELYYQKLLTMLAADLNRSVSSTGGKYFFWKDSEEIVKISKHEIVRYNLVYFNSESLAKQALRIMGGHIKYVV